MSGTTSNPLHRRMTLVLDGSKSDFRQMKLDWNLRQSSSVVLVSYTVLNTPVTSSVPDTPFLSVDFESVSCGFELIPQISNYPVQHSIVLPLVGLNTQNNYSATMVLGEIRGSRLAEVNLRIKDATGTPHNASSNKLFDWVILELLIVESGREPTPLFLKDIPTIQQTWNTI